MRICKVISSLALPLAFLSCASEYQIEGSSSVSRLDGKMLFVKVPHEGTMHNIDSVEVVHGLFKMQGTIDSTMMGSLFMDDQNIVPIVLEKGKIHIDIDSRIKVGGTPLNDRLFDFINKRTILGDRYDEVMRSQSRMIMDGIAEEEIEATISRQQEELNTELNNLVKNVICDNFDNVLGPGIFMIVCSSSYPYPVITPLIEEIMEKAPDSFKNHFMIRDYMEVARRNMGQ